MTTEFNSIQAKVNKETLNLENKQLELLQNLIKDKTSYQKDPTKLRELEGALKDL